MLFALDKDGNKIHINFAQRNQEYFCPCCGEKVIPKLGEIKMHHYAHHNESKCEDHWHYDMSEWHYNWQANFPIECQEIVKTLHEKKHRADVLIEKAKTVFEFQHSALSPNEFEERNNFYNALGYKVIWVFDVQEQYQCDNIINYKDDLWKWKYPRNTFNHFNYRNENVKIYLQVDEDDVMLVTWCTSDSGFSRFMTDGKFYYYREIVDMVNDDEEYEDSQNNVVINELKISDLYDALIELYSKDHTTYFFGCPISITHMCANCNLDVPQSKYSEIMPCMECEYECKTSNCEELVCKKRFRDLNLDDNTIVQIHGRDENGFINKISYNIDGLRKIIEIPTYKLNVGKSVFALWQENNYSVAVFKNVRTGKYVKITRNPIEQYQRYHGVYGYFSLDGYDFSGASKKLFNVNKPEWICTWFR